MTFSPEPISDSAITANSDLANRVRDRVESEFTQRVATLGKLVRIPGIAWDAFDANDLVRSAEAVAKLFEETGVFDKVEIKTATVDGKPGAPAVLASRPAKNEIGRAHV